nr:putative beta-1,3-glucan synthase catalytic subunit 3 [Candida parapsilosis]
MAKLVRHLTSNEEIVGSNPAESIITFLLFFVAKSFTLSFLNFTPLRLHHRPFYSSHMTDSPSSMTYNDGPYHAWCKDNGAKVSTDTILATFTNLGRRFGFQEDNVNNMYELFMTQLDSRSSRMDCSEALLSLHLHYIGGDSANYKKWYVTAQFPYEDETWTPKDRFVTMENDEWRHRLSSFREEDYVFQIALYLLIWGEANNVRFMPECICFIYQCALDYVGPDLERYYFLEKIITPLYKFLRDQQYKLVGDRWSRKEIDHSQTIGYDDVNQHFWSPGGLYKIRLDNGTRVYKIKRKDRFKEIHLIDWKKSLSKTYRERRTWIHVLNNFNRIWIVHVSVFWYFMSFNSPSLYTADYTPEKSPLAHVRLAIVSAGGAIAALISLFAAISEFLFINSKNVKKLITCAILLILNIAPIVVIFIFLPWSEYSYKGNVVSGLLLTFSILTFVYLAMVPPGSFSSIFSNSFPKLTLRNRAFSISLWVVVFAAKYSESYFFLILSLKDPIQILSTLTLNCNDGHFLCPAQPKITLCLFYFTDLILFFLDTYLWYVICNVIFSVGLSFSLGVSIFTPWRNIFSRLPDRILTKVYHGDSSNSLILVISQIWNGIVISMFREHILSVEQVKKLIYQREEDEGNVKPPLFFANEDDNTFKLLAYIKIEEEWERRITFFAQSLSSPLPDPFPVVSMPAFTVLIPHYSEKILLGLKDLIKEQSFSKLTLLEYLKQLHSKEWSSFVKDSKMIQSLDDDDDDNDEGLNEYEKFKQNEDLPYYCIGFKDSAPENTLRTRIWAALRCQTLYRTVSGFMNYEVALKILYRSENIGFESEGDLFIEREMQEFVDRKFNLIVAMQNFQSFTPETIDDADVLFRAFPNVKIAILEVENGTYYSTLLDVSQRDHLGNYRKRFKIRLSGNPILGDGKSDNQNNALIFYRGEYIQVIDSNQDNYVEECIKIKSLLTEFEEMDLDVSYGYTADSPLDSPPTVAIVGSREFIFSQNIGILGDIAAGKEQTFGTLFARTMGEIGSKLHYGHPDFLNGIFMTTRGGISKAQRGLHLNEDIYAGITAMCRGGRIKHFDYYQCGKGRDLGFQSIVNFTKKIGAGMGEQLLSREYFYLGTRLPIDRFLSFYYAHPGFHINNLSIMLSVKIFMFLVMNLGALNHNTVECDESNPVAGCHTLMPVLNWIDRFILSVFVCFFISFLPLIIQELIEKGFVRSIFRVILHIVSLSPFFEVFLCQVYSRALRDNFVFGEAQYIATGRDFAISRISFATLYTRYANLSIYSGIEIFMVILFGMMTVKRVALLWFVITVLALCFAPFMFNPHQFSFMDFFLDYRDFIRWLSRGNSKAKESSWIQFCQNERSRLTGEKFEGHLSGRNSTTFNLLLGEVATPLISFILYLIPFLFLYSSNKLFVLDLANPLIRVAIAIFAPYVLNIVVLLFIWVLSMTVAPVIGLCVMRIPSFFAALAHFLSILFHVVNIEFLFLLQEYSFIHLISALLVVFSFHRAFSSFILITCVSRERGENVTNKAWWSGKWYRSGLGFRVITQNMRELIIKMLELNKFTFDFVLGHVLLLVMLPLLFVPYIDTLHTSLLFWLKPSRQFKRAIISKRQRRKKNWQVVRYFFLFVLIVATFISLVVIPPLFKSQLLKLQKKLTKMVIAANGSGN